MAIKEKTIQLDVTLPEYGSLVDFNAWVQELYLKIPSEHISSAKVEFWTRSGYDGDSSPTVQVYYTRPETDDEVRFREGQEAAVRGELVKRELVEFNRLQEKYG